MARIVRILAVASVITVTGGCVLIGSASAAEYSVTGSLTAIPDAKPGDTIVNPATKIGATVPKLGESVTATADSFSGKHATLRVSADANGQVTADSADDAAPTFQAMSALSECTDSAYGLNPGKWNSSIVFKVNHNYEPSNINPSDLVTANARALAHWLRVSNNCGYGDFMSTGSSYGGVAAVGPNVLYSSGIFFVRAATAHP